MNRIWNCLTRGFRSRAPASPSQTSSQYNDENENVQHSSSDTARRYQFFYNSIQKTFSKRLILNTVDFEKKSGYANNDQDSSQYSGKSADSVVYGAATALFFSQVVRYVGGMVNGVFQKSDHDCKNGFDLKSHWPLSKPTEFTVKAVLPKVPFVAQACSTAHAASENASASESLTVDKSIRITNGSQELKLSKKKQSIVPEEDLEKFLTSTKQCLSMTYSLQGLQSYKKGKYADAFQNFKLGSEGGSKNAQYYLGTCYQQGKGTKQNIKQAKKEYSRASRQGHEIAQYNLALLLLEERNILSIERALFWLEKSADAGLLQAQALAGSYFAQEGKHHNMKKAVKMFQLAAAQEDPLSTYHLAECYEHGLGGLKVDADQAFELYASAASLGHADAHFKMAMILLSGCPEIEKNEEVALEILQKAKELGHEESSRKYEQLMRARECKKSITSARTATPSPSNSTFSTLMFPKLFQNLSSLGKVPEQQIVVDPMLFHVSPMSFPFNADRHTDGMHRVASWPAVTFQDHAFKQG